MRSRHFAAPSHRPSVLSFPRFHHRQGNLQSSSSTRPDSQQTLNTPPPLSLVSTARPQRSLSAPSDRQISHCRPDHRRSHPLSCWTLLAVSPPQFANVQYIVQTRLVSTATHPPASTLLRRNPGVGPPATLNKSRLHRTTRDKDKDKRGTGTRRCVTLQYIDRGTTPKSRQPPPKAPTKQSGRLLIAEYGLCHCVPEAQTQHSPSIVLRRPHPDCLAKP